MRFAEEEDLSDCPFFLGTGTCSYGCMEEPQCMTCQPMEGWPSGKVGVFSAGLRETAVSPTSDPITSGTIGPDTAV